MLKDSDLQKEIKAALKEYTKVVDSRCWMRNTVSWYFFKGENREMILEDLNEALGVLKNDLNLFVELCKAIGSIEYGTQGLPAFPISKGSSLKKNLDKVFKKIKEGKINLQYSPPLYDIKDARMEVFSAVFNMVILKDCRRARQGIKIIKILNVMDDSIDLFQWMTSYVF